MNRRSRRIAWGRLSLLAIAWGALLLPPSFAQNKRQATCTVKSVDYRGWSAQQLSNQWETLVVVPENGGRLMQVSFAGHDYLFVNPELAGKYMPPTAAQWFNYGGDKLWLLPEGNDDEQHWPGNSDLLDDGPYSFKKLSEGQTCEIELVSPADPQTGIQFTRTIHIDTGSPQIQFRSRMKNITGHTLEWSVQSVSQYSTSIPGDPTRRNPDIWGFTPANASSTYLNRYHVRFGPAENPAAAVNEDGLFSVHYAHLAAELWIDSVAGWLAVVDGGSRFAMVEKFQYEPTKTYPGRASVIFWTNGPELHLGDDGEAGFGNKHPSPYYMEAELNSPMCRLKPGEECRFDTDWFPTRAEADIRDVNDAGIVIHSLRSMRVDNDKLELSGSFGVFYAGHLIAHVYDQHGSKLGTMQVAEVSPTELVNLKTEISPGGIAARVALHLVDENGIDRGALQEVRVNAQGNDR
ncbi:MAG TPA: hypothetical protein VL128_03750 [Candidatus Eisenbacteria bacterium]|nr:hypothetical protein [Candidatus Eisenbacteria bacterium]